jgi:cation diffusion facilitator CzcD-associated flavoprotein CzcO
MTAIEARSGDGGEVDHSERHLRVVVVGAGFSGLSVASGLAGARGRGLRRLGAG